MGLDMYARTTKTCPPTAVDFETNETDEELHYWRKHPNLHGWMEKLYRLKGGKHSEFNCSTVLLTLGDLDLLEAAINCERLPETTGFFFGNSDGSERADDLEFIAKARLAFASG